MSLVHVRREAHRGAFSARRAVTVARVHRSPQPAAGGCAAGPDHSPTFCWTHRESARTARSLRRQPDVVFALFWHGAICVVRGEIPLVLDRRRGLAEMERPGRAPPPPSGYRREARDPSARIRAFAATRQATFVVGRRSGVVGARARPRACGWCRTASTLTFRRYSTFCNARVIFAESWITHRMMMPLVAGARVAREPRPSHGTRWTQPGEAQSGRRC